jgi:hypothetical protein
MPASRDRTTMATKPMQKAMWASGEVEQHEKDQQRDAHQDFGDGDRRQYENRQEPRPVAVHRQTGHRPE